MSDTTFTAILPIYNEEFTPVYTSTSVVEFVIPVGNFISSTTAYGSAMAPLELPKPLQAPLLVFQLQYVDGLELVNMFHKVLIYTLQE